MKSGIIARTLLGGALSLLLLPFPPSAPTPPPETIIIDPVVDRGYLSTVLLMIGDARKTIDFIQLEFHYDPTVKKVQTALREALKRGVRVRGLIEDGLDFNPTSLRYLTKFGIEAKLDSPKKMTHNKLFIVDGDKVLLGSTNLSFNSIDNNHETNVYIENRRLGKFFEDYFGQLWKDSFAEPVLSPPAVPGVRAVINRGHFDALSGLIESARKKVWVVIYGMRYYDKYPDSKTNQLIDSLIAARKRGVDVKVSLDKSDYNQTLNQINERTKEHLEAGGVEVRYDSEAITTHAKLLIVDGAVMVGSANWGYLALEKRNECSLIVTDPGVTDFFEKYFLNIWAEGAPSKNVASCLPTGRTKRPHGSEDATNITRVASCLPTGRLNDVEKNQFP